jgi:hypothetical protein
MIREVLLDVSELEPPAPLVLTLQTAEELKPGQYLRMLHRRDPCLLYDNLENNHFKYFQRQGLVTTVELFIWHENDSEAAAAVKAITGQSGLNNR